MLRSLVKDAVAHAISWTRLDAVAYAALHRDVPYVIAYHRVVDQLNVHEGVALPSMEISVAMLEKHLDWLGRRFQIVSLDDLGTKMHAPAGSKPIAAVTFDDGYSDVFHHGFPLLKRKGIPAGIFVVSDLVGTSELPVHDRLHALLAEAWSRWTSPRNALAGVLRTAGVKLTSPQRLPGRMESPFAATRHLLNHFPYTDVQLFMDCLETDTARRPTALQPMTWEMLATMRDSGMTIGSHSKTHAFLTNESQQRMQEEAEISRRALQQRLGTAVNCFAYPGGTFNANVVQAVDGAGYRFAFTICRHRDPQYPMLTIPRRGLWERSSLDSRGRFSQAIMACQAAGTFDRFSACRSEH